MTASEPPVDKALRDRMMAALELAWLAVSSEAKGLAVKDGADMALAILTAAIDGEKDFQSLQRHAIDVLAKRGVVSTAAPLDRRKRPR